MGIIRIVRGQRYQKHGRYWYRLSWAWKAPHYVCPTCGRVSEDIGRVHGCNMRHGTENIVHKSYTVGGIRTVHPKRKKLRRFSIMLQKEA